MKGNLITAHKYPIRFGALKEGVWGGGGLSEFCVKRLMECLEDQLGQRRNAVIGNFNINEFGAS